MLPPGHIAAGYLTAYGLLKVLKPDLAPTEIHQLYLWGMFWGFVPDLDTFYYFFRNGNWLVAGTEGLKKNHRQYYSHAPILWLIAGLLVYFLVTSVYLKIVGLLIWLGAWSHFLLDSVEYGIMWLWPFSKKLYALKNREVKIVIEEKNFFKHCFLFIKLYAKRLSFWLVLLIIFCALIILI